MSITNWKPISNQSGCGPDNGDNEDGDGDDEDDDGAKGKCP